MPPKVVKTIGRNVRCWEMHPARCLAFFSWDRVVKITVAEPEAAEECDGRSGQETVASIATTGGSR